MRLRLGAQYRQLVLYVTLLAGLANAARAQTPEAQTSGAPSTSAATDEAASPQAPDSSPGSEAAIDQEAAAIVAQLGGETPGGTLDTTPPTISFYGFMDAGLQRAWGTLVDSGLGLTDAMNFFIGNVNLYIDTTPAPGWRGLAEVRFTTLPNGAESLNPATGTFTRHSTTVFDYTAATGGLLAVDWGAIILERAHIDWMPRGEINVRVGYFLTPYGIFNVDHSSATRIMLIATAAMAYNVIPERQIGIQIFGLFNIADWELGYHLYVSNGRTTSVDFTDDKALGGRVYFQFRDRWQLQIGGSFFWGNSQNVEKSVGLNNGELGIVRTTTVEYSELAGGLDVSLDADALRVRVEGIANQTIYTEGKRPIYFGTPRANFTMMAVYGIVAYQLPWLNMEPALYAEWSTIPSPGIEDEWLALGGGLNFYITPTVIIRCHFVYSHDLEDGGNETYLAGARLVITY